MVQPWQSYHSRVCLDVPREADRRRLFAVFPASKALFRRDCPNKLTPYPLSKKSLFQKLATRVRNFSFPGRSLTRLFPAGTQTLSGSKPFSRPRNYPFPGSETFVSRPETNIFIIFLFPPPPPPPARHGVSKQPFPLEN